MSYRDVPLTEFAAWFDANAHSTQYLRILRSGLKPEFGAWERSKLRLEVASGEWFHTPKMIAAEERRLRMVRRKNRRAKIGMPKTRKKAGEFRAADAEERVS